MRFIEVSDKDVVNILSEKGSKKTQDTVDNSMRIWKEYLSTKAVLLNVPDDDSEWEDFKHKLDNVVNNKTNIGLFILAYYDKIVG